MKNLRWSDPATLVRLPVGDQLSTIIKEGPLWSVLLTLENWPFKRLDTVKIALPERRTAPYHLNAAAITALLLNPDRPGEGPLTDLQSRRGLE